MYATSRITVAINTEKSVPLNSAIHRVAGGNRQIRSIQTFPPETVGENGAWRNSDGANMETGPRMYIPVRIHPHSGGSLVTIQLAATSKVTPASGRAFKIHRFAFSWRATEIATNGSQNERPPIAIQYNLLLIAHLIRSEESQTVARANEMRPGSGKEFVEIDKIPSSLYPPGNPLLPPPVLEYHSASRGIFLADSFRRRDDRACFLTHPWLTLPLTPPRAPD
jgi:hypothetical protein